MHFFVCDINNKHSIAILLSVFPELDSVPNTLYTLSLLILFVAQCSWGLLAPL